MSDPVVLKKPVFIDRDGVINVDLMGDYVKSWDEFRFEQGAVEALKLLTQRGYDILIISNQAGIGDGVFPESQLWDTHRNMLETLSLEGVKITDAFFCLHGKKAGCKCRKPETGLFEQAAKAYQFDTAATFFIGDKATDMEAGRRFGLKTLFVRTGHGLEDEPRLDETSTPDLRADNLLEAVKMLPL